jgi:hypothetical protein
MLDIDSAVKMRLEQTPNRPNWLSTNFIAAFHILHSDILIHPDMQVIMSKKANGLTSRRTSAGI